MYVYMYVVMVTMFFGFSYVYCPVGSDCSTRTCLTLLASFFLPSHLSFKNMYMYMYIQLLHMYIQLPTCILHMYMYAHVSLVTECFSSWLCMCT